MQKIGNITNTANADGEFTEGNPGAGAAATLLKAGWFNTVQRELAGLVLGANIALNASDDNQVFKAVKALASAANDFLSLQNKPTTLAGYGISDAIKVGQFGLGSSTASGLPIDIVGLGGGFYYYGAGNTGFGNNVGLVNIPYGIQGYAGQIGFQQGTAEPTLLIRACKAADTWGPTRSVWHSGNFDPAVKADKSTTDASLNLKAPLASPSFTGTVYVPTAPAGSNNLLAANTAFVQAAIAAFVGGAPAALDTLKELADALGGDANFATTVTNGLANKLAIGQFGLGGSTASGVPIDSIGLPGGFYYYGAGSTGFGNNVSLVNIPYGIAGYAGQIGIRQGQVEPEVLVRGCQSNGVWGNTRKLWHSGNFDPNALLPTGTSIAFASSSVPVGFLKENGAAVSRTVYANLFAVIGTFYGAGDGSTTFNLPDSRGEFIRGADDGRGVDSGRAVGSWQDSQNKAHTHSYGAQHNTNFGLSATGYAGVSPGSQVMYETASSGGSESRPRNTARLMCIKY